jgi:hypothetical protein
MHKPNFAQVRAVAVSLRLMFLIWSWLHAILFTRSLGSIVHEALTFFIDLSNYFRHHGHHRNIHLKKFQQFWKQRRIYLWSGCIDLTLFVCDLTCVIKNTLWTFTIFCVPDPASPLPELRWATACTQFLKVPPSLGHASSKRYPFFHFSGKEIWKYTPYFHFLWDFTPMFSSHAAPKVLEHSQD